MNCFNRLISAMIIACFLLNTACSDYVMALAPSLVLDDIADGTTQHKTSALAEMELAMDLEAIDRGGIASLDGVTDAELIKAAYAKYDDLKVQRFQQDKGLPRQPIIPYSKELAVTKLSPHVFRISVSVERQGKDKDYHNLLFSTVRRSKSEPFPVIACTNEELDRMTAGVAIHDKLPERSERDQKTIEKYKQHENGIDYLIELAHRYGCAKKPLKERFNYEQMVGNILKELSIGVRPQKGIKPIEKREFYLIDLFALKNALSKAGLDIDIHSLRVTTIVGEDGKEYNIYASAHSSNDSIHAFCSETNSLDFEMFANPKAEIKTDNDKTDFDNMARSLCRDIGHEIGVAGARPILNRFGENEIDKRWSALTPGQPLPRIDMTLVDLDVLRGTNAAGQPYERDYAMSESDTGNAAEKASIPQSEALTITLNGDKMRFVIPVADMTLIPAKEAKQLSESMRMGPAHMVSTIMGNTAIVKTLLGTQNWPNQNALRQTFVNINFGRYNDDTARDASRMIAVLNEFGGSQGKALALSIVAKLHDRRLEARQFMGLAAESMWKIDPTLAENLEGILKEDPDIQRKAYEYLLNRMLDEIRSIAKDPENWLTHAWSAFIILQQFNVVLAQTDDKHWMGLRVRMVFDLARVLSEEERSNERYLGPFLKFVKTETSRTTFLASDALFGLVSTISQEKDAETILNEWGGFEKFCGAIETLLSFACATWPDFYFPYIKDHYRNSSNLVRGYYLAAMRFGMQHDDSEDVDSERLNFILEKTVELCSDQSPIVQRKCAEILTSMPVIFIQYLAQGGRYEKLNPAQRSFLIEHILALRGAAAGEACRGHVARFAVFEAAQEHNIPIQQKVFFSRTFIEDLVPGLDAEQGATVRHCVTFNYHELKANDITERNCREIMVRFGMSAIEDCYKFFNERVNVDYDKAADVLFLAGHVASVYQAVTAEEAKAFYAMFGRISLLSRHAIDAKLKAIDDYYLLCDKISEAYKENEGLEKRVKVAMDTSKAVNEKAAELELEKRNIEEELEHFRESRDRLYDASRGGELFIAGFDARLGWKAILFRFMDNIADTVKRFWRKTVLRHPVVQTAAIDIDKFAHLNKKDEAALISTFIDAVQEEAGGKAAKKRDSITLLKMQRREARKAVAELMGQVAVIAGRMYELNRRLKEMKPEMEKAEKEQVAMAEAYMQIKKRHDELEAFIKKAEGEMKDKALADILRKSKIAADMTVVLISFLNGPSVAVESVQPAVEMFKDFKDAEQETRSDKEALGVLMAIATNERFVSLIDVDEVSQLMIGHIRYQAEHGVMRSDLNQEIGSLTEYLSKGSVVPLTPDDRLFQELIDGFRKRRYALSLNAMSSKVASEETQVRGKSERECREAVKEAREAAGAAGDLLGIAMEQFIKMKLGEGNELGLERLMRIFISVSQNAGCEPAIDTIFFMLSGEGGKYFAKPEEEEPAIPRNRAEMIEKRYRKYYNAMQALREKVMESKMKMLRIEEGFGWNREANDAVLRYVSAAYTSLNTSLEVKLEAEKALWLLTLQDWITAENPFSIAELDGKQKLNISSHAALSALRSYIKGAPKLTKANENVIIGQYNSVHLISLAYLFAKKIALITDQIEPQLRPQVKETLEEIQTFIGEDITYREADNEMVSVRIAISEALEKLNRNMQQHKAITDTPMVALSGKPDISIQFGLSAGQFDQARAQIVAGSEAGQKAITAGNDSSRQEITDSGERQRLMRIFATAYVDKRAESLGRAPEEMIANMMSMLIAYRFYKIDNHTYDVRDTRIGTRYTLSIEGKGKATVQAFSERNRASAENTSGGRHEGKSPEGAKTVIALYLLSEGTFTAPEYLAEYKEHWKELGFEKPADNVDSALRTVRRDLASLVKEGYLEILPNRGVKNGFVYRITEKGRALFDTLRAPADSNPERPGSEIGGDYDLETIYAGYIKGLLRARRLSYRERFELVRRALKEQYALRVMARILDSLTGFVGNPPEARTAITELLRTQYTGATKEVLWLAFVSSAKPEPLFIGNTEIKGDLAALYRLLKEYRDTVHVALIDENIGEPDVEEKVLKSAGGGMAITQARLIHREISELSKSISSGFSGLKAGLRAVAMKFMIPSDARGRYSLSDEMVSRLARDIYQRTLLLERLQKPARSGRLRKPGKSPEDAKALIALYLLNEGTFTASRYLAEYAAHWEELGLDKPADDTDSALRTVRRDLHEDAASLVKEGYLEILPDPGAKNEKIYRITNEGKAVLSTLYAPAYDKKFEPYSRLAAIETLIKIGHNRKKVLEFAKDIADKRDDLAEQIIASQILLENKEDIEGRLAFLRHLAYLEEAWPEINALSQAALISCGYDVDKLVDELKRLVVDTQYVHVKHKPRALSALISEGRYRDEAVRALKEGIFENEKVESIVYKVEASAFLLKNGIDAERQAAYLDEIAYDRKSAGIGLYVRTRAMSALKSMPREATSEPEIGRMETHSDGMSREDAASMMRALQSTQDDSGRKGNLFNELVGLAAYFTPTVHDFGDKVYNDIAIVGESSLVSLNYIEKGPTGRPQMNIFLGNRIICYIGEDGIPHDALNAQFNRTQVLNEIITAIRRAVSEPEKVAAEIAAAKGHIAEAGRNKWLLDEAFLRARGARKTGIDHSSVSDADLVDRLGTGRYDLQDGTSFLAFDEDAIIEALKRKSPALILKQFIDLFNSISRAAYSLPEYQRNILNLLDKAIELCSDESKRIVIEVLREDFIKTHEINVTILMEGYMPQSELWRELLRQALKLLPREWKENGMDYADLRQALEYSGVPDSVLQRTKLDDNSVLIFSEKLAFTHGLGVLLPKFASSGMKVAVVAPNKKEKDLIDKLNAGKPENQKIICEDSIERIQNKIKAARYYYFRSSDEEEVAGLLNVPLAVEKILKALGRVVGIAESSQSMSDLYQATRKFIEAAA